MHSKVEEETTYYKVSMWGKVGDLFSIKSLDIDCLCYTLQLAYGICLFFWFNLVINIVLCVICVFSVILLENILNQLFLNLVIIIVNFINFIYHSVIHPFGCDSETINQ